MARISREAGLRWREIIGKLPRFSLSKTTFMQGCQCAKSFWLHKSMYEWRRISDETQAKFDEGKVIGDLAKHLFGDDQVVWRHSLHNNWEQHKEVLQCKTPFRVPTIPYRISSNAWVENTLEYLLAHVPAPYFDAAFAYHDLLATLDVLNVENEQNVAYEAKAMSEINDVVLDGCAFQYHVISQNIPLSDFRLILINEPYFSSLGMTMKDLTLQNTDIHELFVVKSVLSEILERQDAIKNRISEMKKLVKQKSAPNISMGNHCHNL